MHIVSREYKTMLAHERFADRASAVASFWSEIKELARAMPDVGCKGELDTKQGRTITFLDTPDRTLRRSGLVFRERSGQDGTQYTLKCRSEDRYFAAGADVGQARGRRAEEKLEEDIAPPFRCRFSHSVTTSAGEAERPGTLGGAADLFPGLKAVRVDERRCPPGTRLCVVGNMSAYERVYTGARLRFRAGAESEDATVALILWSGGKEGRPLAAEASFRIRNERERFGRDVAATARSFFGALQQLDWSRPGAATKTEFVYRDSAGV